MKSNVDKLADLGILGDVRQRLGADDENDTSKDEKINEMDNSRLIKEWCGWNLGDGSWWTIMKSYYDKLEEK